MPMNNEVVIHNESGYFYKIVSVTEDAFTGERIVKYSRLCDGFSKQLPVQSFLTKFREATPEQIHMLAAVFPRVQGTTTKLTVEMLNNLYNQGGATSPNAPNAENDDSGALAEGVDTSPKIGILMEPDEGYEFSRMIIHPDVEESIKIGLNKIVKRDEIEAIFGNLESTSSSRNIMNFYGPPGTGKTMAARCIARKLGKKLFQVDYSQMISKWVGDTGKHIKQAFMEAKQNDAILFWDEADSLMSKRVSMTDDAVGTSINQNRNILMQELDRFEGIVIMASNFFGNYDDALLRRIAQHVKFEVPNESMRERLLIQNFPKMERVVVDFKKVAKETKGFSGGDLNNVVRNARDHAAILDDDSSKWKITDEIMLKEVKKIKDSKDAHKGNGKVRRGLGISAEFAEEN